MRSRYPHLVIYIILFTCTVRAPVFGRHQFFGTSEHYGKAHWSLLSGWMNYNYTACCWFPTSSNILTLPSQFWQIRFERCWLHCSKCRILVCLRYLFTLCKFTELYVDHYYLAYMMAYITPNRQIAIYMLHIMMSCTCKIMNLLG